MRRLKADGYYVILHTGDQGKEVFAADPNVDEVIVHVGFDWSKAREVEVPKGARIVDLTRSDSMVIEGTYRFGCVKHPMCYSVGCELCEEAKKQRDEELRELNHEELVRKNYSDELPQMYFTPEEIKEVDEATKGWKGKFVVVWCCSTSAEYKIYPYWFEVMWEFTERHEDAVVYSLGASKSGPYQASAERIIPVSDWSFRKSVIAASKANLMVGTEGAMFAACGAYPVPKIVLLSVSAPANVAKYWVNCTCIEPDVPCHPCHQIHHAKWLCPTVKIQVETPKIDAQWPICMAEGIKTERLLSVMEIQYADLCSQKEA